MSYTSSLFHIVFSTKRREAVITPRYAEDLYRVMAGIVNKGGSKAILINGVENHIHVLLNLHPDKALSSVVRDLKSQSSLWMKKSGFFPMFDGWEKEYGAFSISYSHKTALYDYIKGQEEHHKSAHLDDEFRRLVIKSGLTYYFDKFDAQ